MYFWDEVLEVFTHTRLQPFSERASTLIFVNGNVKTSIFCDLQLRPFCTVKNVQSPDLPSSLCWKTFFIIVWSDFEPSYARLTVVQPLHLQLPGSKRLKTKGFLQYGADCYNED